MAAGEDGAATPSRRPEPDAALAVGASDAHDWRMRDRSSQAATANHFPAERTLGGLTSRLVQPAPGPEAPDARDKAGAQSGMVLMLVGGGLFWIGVAAVVAYFLR